MFRHSALSAVNVELIFCFKLHTNVEYFMVIINWLCMPVLIWFIFLTLSWRGVRLPSTESTRSETPRHWVNAEWDSTSLSQREVRLHVNWVNAEGTNIYEDFVMPGWLSWRGVSLRVDSVDVESHLALTQLMGNETRRQLSHRRMLKNSIKSANSSQNRKHSKVLLFGLCLFDRYKKTGTRKCHTSVPLKGQLSKTSSMHIQYRPLGRF